MIIVAAIIGALVGMAAGYLLRPTIDAWRAEPDRAASVGGHPSSRPIDGLEPAADPDGDLADGELADGELADAELADPEAEPDLAGVPDLEGDDEEALAADNGGHDDEGD